MLAVIAIVELAERFSYYGTTVVFVNFIQQPLPPGSRTGAPLDSEGQAGALGLGQRASTGITTANTFWCVFRPARPRQLLQMIVAEVVLLARLANI